MEYSEKELEILEWFYKKFGRIKRISKKAELERLRIYVKQIHKPYTVNTREYRRS